LKKPILKKRNNIYELPEQTAVCLSEGRGQNNQQPTPNDNKKQVVVFLCGSGI